MPNPLLNNFTGGEVTPKLDARLDLQKYISSLRIMENFRPSAYGGAEMRPGLVRAANTKANGVARMVNFVLDTSTIYKLEFGPYYIRFYRNKAQIGPGYEIPTPYAAAHLFQLCFRQINSVMYITHELYPVQKLSSFADANWSLGPVVWDYPALLDQNLTETTITPSGTTGAITVTASSSIFQNPAHVGASFELAYKREGASVVLDISGSAGTVTSSPIQVKGDWSVVTSQYWYGTLKIQRSIDNTAAAALGWETIREFVSKASRNINGSGSELKNTYLRMEYTATGNPFGANPPWVGTPPATYVTAQVVLETSQVFVTGIIQITSVASGTVASANVIGAELPLAAATKYWSEGAWSDYRGYPRAIGLYEQRVMFAGTTYQPNTTWGSKTGDFQTIEYSDSDDSALAVQIADSQQNPIYWLSALDKICLGTSGEEQILGSGNGDEALSPNNVTVRRHSSYGSAQIQALPIDSGIVFVQRQGRRLRELQSTGVSEDPASRVCPDLTLFAEHITEGGIVQMDFARLPDPQIFTVRADGQMPVLAYNREQNVMAWARYVTDGEIESVACGYGSPNDEVWAVVKREIGHDTVRTVEYFADYLADRVNGVFLDGAYLRDSGSPVTSVTGLTWLEAETVSAVVDGTLYEGLAVTGGVVTLPGVAPAGTVWRVGLPYIATLLPMKLDSATVQGSTAGRVKSINEFTIRFISTIGVRFGQSLSAMDEIDWRSITALMDQTPDLYTGDITLPWPSVIDVEPDLYIQQNKPFPCSVIAIIPSIKLFG